MAYRSDTIATVTKLLNDRYFLPAIQREFVWTQDQVCQLFDSLMRGYPISSFLFWELKPGYRDRWSIYKFIDHANDRGPNRNDQATTDGVQQLTLVLDGQQRLTSLLLGLKGTYAVKRKYKWKDNPDAWSKQSLFLDLLKDPREVQEDDEAGLRYAFKFLEKPSGDGNRHYWFKVGRVLDFHDQEAFDVFLFDEVERLPGGTTKDQTGIFKRNLDALYRTIWKNEAIAYHIEHEQDYDRVLDIFVRTNAGGTKLSKSDLLLSMITSKWEGINARDEIYEFVDFLNRELTSKNDLTKDFVMKSCLVLSDLPVGYTVANFNDRNLETIRTKWPMIKKYIQAGIDLVNSFGIDRDTLTSANAVIPVIYYLQTHQIQLRGTTPFDGRNATAARRWLTASLLNNTFGGQGDSLLRDMRDAIKAQALIDKEFPLEKLNDAAKKSGRPTGFDEEALASVMEVEYGDTQAFLALSLLYDEMHWGTTLHHQDHIFSQALFKRNKMEELGIPREKQAPYKALMNRLGNLELLLARENEEKSGKEFDQWITTRNAEFRKKHLIPADDGLVGFDRFEEFMKAREALIRERLREVLGLRAQKRERAL